MSKRADVRKALFGDADLRQFGIVLSLVAIIAPLRIGT